MLGPNDVVVAVEVGNGARDFANPVQPPAGEPAVLQFVAQQCRAARIDRRELVEQTGAQCPVE